MGRSVRHRRRRMRRRSPRQRKAGKSRPRGRAPVRLPTTGRTGAEMLSIGALASASQGASYYERDGYYAKDDPEHREASAWAGRGAEELGLTGPVDPGTFRAVLEGRVPDGSGKQLGRRGRDGEFLHRPGRDLTFSAPKSVSIAALVGGDNRIVEAHDRAVATTLAWVEKHAAETRMKSPDTGRMARASGQKIVAATFRHDTSRNLDPQLHTHAVLANMVQSADGKWRSMANEGLYARQKLIGMLYRNELAAGLSKLGYGIEKSHADGRFEIAGVPREVVAAFSTRRAEIEAAMEARGLGASADNPRLAERAALMTRAAKRDIDRRELRGVWRHQAADLGFDAKGLVAEAVERSASPEREATAEPAHPSGRDAPLTLPTLPEPGVGPHGRGGSGKEAGATRQAELPLDGPTRTPAFENAAESSPPSPASEAVAWALAHLSEREAVFARTDLLAAALAHSPGAVTIGEAEREVAALEKAGTLHAVDLPGAEDSLATERTVAEERETVALWRAGAGRGRATMRSWQVQGHLSRGPLTAGQKDAVKLILSAKDRTVGVQGYAGTGKTTMLNRARALAEKKGWRMIGLAPSASAAETLASEAGIATETLQRFLARNAGVAEGRLTRKGAREMRTAFAKTVLVVDEGSLASTVQARDLLRIANQLRIPRVVLVGDAKQLDAVDAGKPFAQLQAAGMQTAVMDQIMRQRDPALKEAVEASLKGDIARAFEKLGENVAEVKPDNIAGAVAARWLRLSNEQRENTGVMAPSHELRQAINGHIRERLAREGRLHGPAMESERLVSKGYTNAEKALAANYSPGDVVAFHRPYKRIGVEKGDERRVVGVDHRSREVLLDDGKGGRVAWKPREIGGRRGGSEVYKVEEIELRAGDRVRWTRNDAGLGLVNSRTAEVERVANGRVTFRLEDGKTLELGRNDPRLRHLDHAWASTVHAFQGRTVDRVIAAMEARHRHLTTQKSFYVEISRARDRAELVTDDAKALREQLEAVTGERIAALEAIGEMTRGEAGRRIDTAQEDGRQAEREPERAADKERRRPATAAKDRSKAVQDSRVQSGPEAARQPERGTGASSTRQREGAGPAKQPATPVRERGGGKGLDLGL
ncbi:MAG: relaxase domain-containing protein [Rhodospirillaceae bacterium]|nr:relaxase domain-containing protein [Rhodospirillaceae bacterium]